MATQAPPVPVAAAAPARRRVPASVRRRRLLVAIADHSLLIAGATGRAVSVAISGPLRRSGPSGASC